MWRHLRAIVLLPFSASVVVPAVLLLTGARAEPGWGLPAAAAWIPVAVGAGLIALGLALMYRTILLFARVGRGTLAPWDPTERLVVEGPYRHVRNPMISGAMAILLGEGLLIGSPAVGVWFGAFVLANSLWMPLVEEPGLRRRFGQDYERYASAVPRWIPRRAPHAG
jgi:protein-S-isoprenylcysteine O-methyltransferase Ste14